MTAVGLPGEVVGVAVTLPVSEVFGPVWQGEGPHTGRCCSFLRLGLCNLRCSWCDTAYTWDRGRYQVEEECPPRSAAWILTQLEAHNTDLLVLSGGEPLIHRDAPALRKVLEQWRGEVHVETNGTLTPPEWMVERVQHWSVSPKLGHGGDPERRRINPGSMTYWAYLTHSGSTIMKFVCRTVSDVAEVERIVDGYNVRHDAVWIMPEGVTLDNVLHHARVIAPAVAARGWNLTLRQHTLMYGLERGR